MKLKLLGGYIMNNISEAKARNILISDDGRFKYSISKNREWGEWVAKAYVDGKYDEGKTIYETDEEACLGSAKADMDRYNKLHPKNKNITEASDYSELDRFFCGKPQLSGRTLSEKNMNYRKILLEKKLDLDVDTPEAAVKIIRDAIDAYYESSSELKGAWQDKGAGRPWKIIAQGLEKALSHIEKNL